jgi:hypothetical protein
MNQIVLSHCGVIVGKNLNISQINITWAFASNVLSVVLYIRQRHNAAVADII